MSRPFAFSYSRLRDWEQCHRQYEHKYILKDLPPEPPDEKRDWGDKVHKALDARATGVPLPASMNMYEKYGRALDSSRRIGLTILTESQFALNRQLIRTDWFAKDAYCRVIIDAGILGRTSAILIDWKTGKKKDDPTQLELNAAAGFRLWPAVQTIETRFVWLGGESPSISRYSRADSPDMWKRILFRAETMERDIAAEDFRPNKSGLCIKHCPVLSCEYNGKGRGA